MSVVNEREEARLVGAIEKAAALALLHPTGRNELLGGILAEAGIETKFAKVASDAFNKRCSVSFFKSVPDDQRTETFELTTAEGVEAAMKKGAGKSPKAEEPARPVIAFVVKKQASAMAKKASLDIPAVPVEERVDLDIMQNRLSNMLDVQKNCFTDRQRKIAGMADALEEKLHKIASYLKSNPKAADEFRNLRNHYGECLGGLLGSLLPEGTSFCKVSSAVVLPAGGIYDEVDNAFRMFFALRKAARLQQDYVKGLAEAADSATDIFSFVQDIKSSGKLPELSKQAGTMGGLARLSVGTMLTLPRAIAGVANAGIATAGTALENARNLYEAGKDTAAAPGKFLDSEFLLKDRYRDRLMAWSDMTADPRFSHYNPDQVFDATQKVMDANEALEQPNRRELLRSYVSQVLAQNNQASTGDLAALATTTKALKDNAPGVGRAADRVGAMDKKLPPTAPAMTGWTVMQRLPEEIVKPFDDAALAQEKELDAQLKLVTDQIRDRDKAEYETAMEQLKSQKGIALEEVRNKGLLDVARTEQAGAISAARAHDRNMMKILEKDPTALRYNAVETAAKTRGLGYEGLARVDRAINYQRRIQEDPLKTEEEKAAAREAEARLMEERNGWVDIMKTPVTQ